MNKILKKIFNKFIASLIEWCANDKSDEHKRAFLIVFCDDKGHTHVAFSNTSRLGEVIPCAVSVNPDAYALYDMINTGVELICEDDFYKSDEWISAINELPFENNTERWFVFDHEWNCTGICRKEVKHDR